MAANVITNTTKDYDNTQLKEVWSPRPNSQQQLMDKFVEIEERLDKIEMYIGLKDKDKEQELKDSRQEIASMRETLETAMARLAQREQELLDTRSQLQNLQNQTADDRQKIRALEDERDKLCQLMRGLEVKLQEREKKIDELENAIGALQDDLGSTKGQLNSTQAELENTKLQVKKTNKLVKNMESQVEQVMRRMDALSAAQSADQQKDELRGTSRLGGASMDLPPIRRNPQTKMNFPPLGK